MNRAERRRRQKENTARGIKKLIEDDIIQEVENQRVEAMLLCFALALHEEVWVRQRTLFESLTAR